MTRMVAQGTRAIDAARRAGAVYAVHEYAHDPRSSLREGGRGYALEAVAALGLDPARVFKTIVVAVDGKLGPGGRARRRRGGPEGGRRRAGRSAVRHRRAAEAERATGYVLGGISPLGTKRRLPTAIDASAEAFETIHVSAGRRGLEIELSVGDLARLTDATWRRWRVGADRSRRGQAYLVLARSAMNPISTSPGPFDEPAMRSMYAPWSSMTGPAFGV